MPIEARSAGKAEIEASKAAATARVAARGRKTATRSVDSMVDLTVEPDEEPEVEKKPKPAGKKRRAADIACAVAANSGSSISNTSSASRSNYILDAPAEACALEPSSPPAKRSGRLKTKTPTQDPSEGNVTSEPPALEIVLKAQGGLFGDQCFPVRGSFHPDKRVTKNAKRGSLDVSNCTIIGRFEDENASPRISSNHYVKLDTDDYVSER